MYIVEKKVVGTEKETTLVLCRGEVGPEFINSIFVGPGSRSPATYKTLPQAMAMARRYKGVVVKTK